MKAKTTEDISHRRSLVRVVHVSSAHRWSDNRVHLREAASLAEAGYEVTLIAVDHDIEVPSTGVHVIRIPRRSRALRFTLGSLQALRIGLSTKSSIFHLHDPELVWAVPFLRVMGKKVIYDAHEDLPSQVMDKHYIPQRLTPLASALARAVVAISRLSSQNIAATERIAERYRKDRVRVIHNYPTLRAEEIDATPLADRDLAVAYVGALGRERGATEMVAAVATKDYPEDWRFKIAGPVVPASLLDELQAADGWQRIEYAGVVGPTAARDILLNSRIGLVLFQSNKAHVDALPTKMFEYMAAGMPVIASNFPLWKSIIEPLDCGVLVDETSPRDIAQAIRRYADDPDLLERHGANARTSALTVFNWAAEAASLVALYDSLAGIKP